MTIQLGVVMDPIANITVKKDGSLAMLLEASRRGWSLNYMELHDLCVIDGKPFATMRPIRVEDNTEHWFDLGTPTFRPLTDLNVILMRKDPPFNIEYIYTTYILELAEAQGVLVVNRPQGLRDFNEKMSTTWFPHVCPPTIVSRDETKLRDFLAKQGKIVLKPLDCMGGSSIFVVEKGDPNLSVILEVMTEYGERFIIAQRYLPEVRQGDKRILLVDGEPIPYLLARVPAEGETRGNIVAGARPEGRPISARDRWICEQIGPTLKARGMIFVGIDVIGDYLTEINVTSPTGIREIDGFFSLNICGVLFDAIEKRLNRTE